MSKATAAVRMHWLASLVALGYGAGAAQATPLPALDVAAITRAADLIVVGQIEEVRVERALSPVSAGVWIKVDHLVKAGKLKAPRVIRLRLSPGGSVGSNISKSQYRMFFLRAVRGGRYVPANPVYPALPAVAADGQSTSVAADSLTSVANELARVLTAPAATADQADAAEALATMSHAKAGAALRAAVASKSPSGRLWALSALFAIGGSERSELANLRSLEGAKDIMLSPTADTRRAVEFLATAIQGRIFSPKAVPVLTTLLRSSEPAVRRAAASVLGDLKTSAIRPLAKLALYDADAEVRSYAMDGLADITGRRRPTDADESSDLRYWRDWAKANLH